MKHSVIPANATLSDFYGKIEVYTMKPYFFFFKKKVVLSLGPDQYVKVSLIKNRKKVGDTLFTFTDKNNDCLSDRSETFRAGDKVSFKFTPHNLKGVEINFVYGFSYTDNYGVTNAIYKEESIKKGRK